MGDVEIDISGKPDGSGTWKLSDEAPDSSTGDDHVEKSKKPLKEKQFIFPVLVVIVIIVGALAIIVAIQLANPITGVQVFLEDGADPEHVSIRILVNTGMFNEFDGNANMRVDHNKQRVDSFPIMIRNSVALTTLRYEEFYVGNGEYTFMVSVDSFSDSIASEFTKTANNIAVSSPTGVNATSTINTAFRLDADEFTKMKASDVLGNGTVSLMDNSTGELISYVNFRVKGTDITRGTVFNATQETRVVGDYIIDFHFTPTSYPRGRDIRAEVFFQNELQPEVTVSGTSDITSIPL